MDAGSFICPCKDGLSRVELKQKGHFHIVQKVLPSLIFRGDCKHWEIYTELGQEVLSKFAMGCHFARLNSLRNVVAQNHWPRGIAMKYEKNICISGGVKVSFCTNMNKSTVNGICSFSLILGNAKFHTEPGDKCKTDISNGLMVPYVPGVRKKTQTKSPP